MHYHAVVLELRLLLHTYVDIIDRKPCSLLRMHNVLIATCVLITMGYHEEIIM